MCGRGLICQNLINRTASGFLVHCERTNERNGRELNEALPVLADLEG